MNRYKYLIKNKLISKPIWDDFLKLYDWKCLACNYAWVSNPEIGYVREVDCNEDFQFNGKKYKRCEKKEYDQLSWYTKEEYSKLREIYFFEKNFEEVYSHKRMHENDFGGKIENGIKYVTLGWHNKRPDNAIECPVCKEIYDILCKYNPLNLFQRVRTLIRR